MTSEKDMDSILDGFFRCSFRVFLSFLGLLEGQHAVGRREGKGSIHRVYDKVGRTEIL